MKRSPALAEQLVEVSPPVRLLVEAAVAGVRRAAPEAEEVVYRSRKPSSPSMMWKLVRYRLNGANVAGVGCFANHAALFFYRGRELEDPAGLLQGGGKDSRFIRLQSPEDARRPELARLVQLAFDLERRR